MSRSLKTKNKGTLKFCGFSGPFVNQISIGKYDIDTVSFVKFAVGIIVGFGASRTKKNIPSEVINLVSFVKGKYFHRRLKKCKKETTYRKFNLIMTDGGILQGCGFKKSKKDEVVIGIYVIDFIELLNFAASILVGGLAGWPNGEIPPDIQESIQLIRLKYPYVKAGSVRMFTFKHVAKNSKMDGVLNID